MHLGEIMEFNSKIINILVVFSVGLCVFSGYASELGKCPKSMNEIFETKCTSCHVNVFVDCPQGSEKLTTREGNPGCTYEQSLGPGHNITKDGCTHTCNRTVQEPECCRGFWGNNCDGKSIHVILQRQQKSYKIREF